MKIDSVLGRMITLLWDFRLWQVGPGIAEDGSAVFAQGPGLVSGTVEDKDVVERAK